MNMFKLDGKTPIPCNDLTEWGKFMNDFEARRVGNTMVGDVRISTVFLGLDHNFSGEGTPVLFETMCFGGRMDQVAHRTETWKEAEQKHAQIVSAVKVDAGIDSRILRNKKI